MFIPENIGVDTGIVFLSRRIAELLGGGNFTTPPRGPRYKIRSAVRGLNSSARIRMHDLWIRKRVCYPLHHSAPRDIKGQALMSIVPTENI